MPRARSLLRVFRQLHIERADVLAASPLPPEIVPRREWPHRSVLYGQQQPVVLESRDVAGARGEMKRSIRRDGNSRILCMARLLGVIIQNHTMGPLAPGTISCGSGEAQVHPPALLELAKTPEGKNGARHLQEGAAGYHLFLRQQWTKFSNEH